MRTLRFHHTGEPLDVLRLEEAEPPRPAPGQIRVAVEVCTINPADLALCRGLYPGDLPRGIGLEVAGTVDALGDDVTSVRLGDAVFGPAPFTGPTAGASGHALLDVWFPRPPALAPAAAAALPMAVDTAQLGLDLLGITAGTTLLVSGGGATTGFAAVQLARRAGARVLTTAGPTHTGALRATGAEVTPYGKGMAERIRELAGGPVDVVLDVSPPDDATIPELLRTVTDPRHVLTISNLAQARESGARDAFTEGPLGHRYDVVGECARLAAESRFHIPVARVIPLADWREAIELSQSQHAGGKIVLRLAEPR
ncbi:NADP-dependent oxidoreductase [Amycolatopsis rifamycinica]|uniref:Alcohol dehydrogenase n=1 Tax=Amycolatopsis rifamycinica TaxID=287986 RepID=A0A066UD10_9PSEU|nr:NADP-dependent oxidoreductase [Amycolatopsis rifamycinica]KDN23742.1 alcohol dehydrogenase [Amycolatopsis rifamycinica]